MSSSRPILDYACPHEITNLPYCTKCGAISLRKV